MLITVKLHATLRRYQPDLPRGAGLALNVGLGTAVNQVMAQVGIPAGAAVVAVVNGKARRLDHVLSEGDTVSLFPPVAGG